MNRPLLEGWNNLLARRPDAPILHDVATGVPCTPSQLDDMAGRIRPMLPERAAGRIIAFRLPNSAGWVAAFLAILRSGGVAMPLDASLTSIQAADLAKEAGVERILEGDMEVARVVRLDEAARISRRLAVAKTTSGSTGRPKVCFFRECELAADGQNIIATMGIRPDDVNFGHIPFGHSYGLGNLIAPFFLQGTPLVAARASIPRVLWQEILDSGATVLPTVPDVVRALASLDLPRAPRLRRVISAGARLDPGVARRFLERHGRGVHNFLGTSETGAIAYDRKGHASLRGEAVGTPVEGVRLTVGRSARLWVESRAVFTHRNRNRVGGVGRFLLRDKVAMAPNGEVMLIGRSGRVIKIGGRRVDLGAFEQRCRRNPDIDDCLAIPLVEDRSFGALFVMRNASGRLAQWLRESFPAWMVPRTVRVVRRIPVDDRGKISVAAARELLSGQGERE